MKNKSFFLTSLFISILIFSLNSCKIEELPSMSCTLDGTSWISTVRVTTFGEADLGNGVGGFLIAATNGADLELSDGEYLTILIRGTEVKDYDLTIALSEGKYQCAAIYFPNGFNTETKFVGSAGTVTLTEINEEDKKISGTFSFTMKNSVLDSDTLSIKSGKFENLTYQEPTALDLGLFTSVK